MEKNGIIALVNKSPEFVDKHDRAGWLDLFSSNAVVEDPVGAGPNRKGKDIRNGKDALGRFYDIFIGPNKIKLDVHQDIVVANEMVREVSIHTTLPNGAITIVHSYLDYKIVEENGQLKIDMLRAHWDLGRNALAMVQNSGLKGIIGSTVQFGAIVKAQGVGRTIEYVGAMYKGIRKKGMKAADAFAAAVNASDEGVLARLFETGAAVHFPVGTEPTSPVDFLRGAGRDVKLEFEGLRSGGWFTSSAFSAREAVTDTHGAVFFEFSPKSRKMVNVRFFWNR
ncbi:MAG: hypothetical protein FJ020_02295 [Chloroflexi bacterium]|nr:hypothetical protein [Chloroflexota bacterium]